MADAVTPTGSTGTTSGDPRRAARTARRAQYRSAGGARTGLVVAGTVLLAAGILTVLLVAGVFGGNRPRRPLLDPMVEQFLLAHGTAARVVAGVAGLLLVLLGLWWAARSLRPETRPDLVLDGGPDTEIRIGASAAADAVADGAASLPGVTRARARTVGSASAPAVRATVWVGEDIADGEVAEICRRLDAEVLPDIRDALGRADLPVAVRLELDAARRDDRPRVS
ncbi:alkaline shock response membrane anchor protein AmaP [Pseudonocardia sp. ICBG1293]|uniref:alkaline shock response membrane anchor protein AmaP n=1 Tax=Pseudonocardia sp. ICBG1293 TaxID=2844382 RepID=UPI001CCEECE6|nr:alkaline shock response membrane anchor protein AmaP [Pseudonocardia sp. ICBG1293]